MNVQQGVNLCSGHDFLRTKRYRYSLLAVAELKYDFVNGGKFRVKKETEQQIWNECSRLITNAVVYYNTVLLLKMYEQKHAAGNDEAQAIIKGISPMAWQHVKLFESFEFNPSMSKIDIDAFVARYADPAYWSKALREEGEPPLD